MSESKAIAARSAISSSRCILATDEHLWHAVPETKVGLLDYERFCNAPNTLIREINEVEELMAAEIKAQDKEESGVTWTAFEQKFDVVVSHAGSVKHDIIDLGNLLERFVQTDQSPEFPTERVEQLLGAVLGNLQRIRAELDIANAATGPT